MAETFVDVRLSAEEAELIDFALDLVTDAYADQAMVERLKAVSYTHLTLPTILLV